MVKSLNRRLNRLEKKKAFPDFRPMTDEQLIYGLLRQAKKAGLYHGDLPSVPIDVRSLLERQRDERSANSNIL